MSGNDDRGPILIVDDDQDVREMLREAFRARGYRCRIAANGREALEVLQADPPLLTVTDMKMPFMDGLELIECARGVDADAVVVVLTGAGDVRTAVASLTGGAFDYILKPVDPDVVLRAARRGLEHRQSRLEGRAERALLARRVAETARELEAAARQLEDTRRSTLEALGSAIESRDVGTQAHSRRVRGYSLALARAHGVPEDQLRDLEHGVLLHDIGKIGIPDAILLKPGPLTPAEWAIMRRHPEIGRQMIEKVPFLRGAVPIVYHHHERWDGTGYPMALRGEAIPLGARIFAAADALDAMTVDRPYSRAVSVEAARREIERCAGTQFDPAVVDTFLAIPTETLAGIKQRATDRAGGADEPAGMALGPARA
jgi:response regulator RpfG family c-di-GMP phosphodiesterase